MHNTNALFTPSEFAAAKSRDVLSFRCLGCGAVFDRTKNQIQRTSHGHKKLYCGHACFALSKKHQIPCTQCSTPFWCGKKSGRKFCSQSCSASYQNAHKTTGVRRSKLEAWMESRLEVLYPNLDIHYNTRPFGFELDIYIPELQLAFELNGIYHYEPIYGAQKLDKIQSLDANKFQECQKRGISLCVIDTSKQGYFKESTALPFLNIITKIIDDTVNAQ